MVERAAVECGLNLKTQPRYNGILLTSEADRLMRANAAVVAAAAAADPHQKLVAQIVGGAIHKLS